MDINQVKDKIAKLLAVVSDAGASENEKEVAMAAAQIYMDKYSLQADECEHAELQFDRIAAEFIGKRPARWEMFLSTFIKKVFSIPCYRDGNAIKFYGRREKVEMAIAMYRELQATIKSLAQSNYGTYYRGDGAVYAEGFCVGLMETYENTLRIREQTEEGRALVVQAQALAEKEEGLATTWLIDEHNVNLRSSSASSGPRGSADAFDHGQSDGKNTNLSSYGGGQLKLGH